MVAPAGTKSWLAPKGDWNQDPRMSMLPRRVMMRTALLVVVFTLALHQVSWPQEGVSVKESAVTFETNGNLTLRSSPPSGWFYTMGDSVGTVEKGKTLLATDEKIVKTLFSVQKWLKVGVQDSKGEQTIAEGWVYAGEVGGQSWVQKKSGGKR